MQSLHVVVPLSQRFHRNDPNHIFYCIADFVEDLASIAASVPWKLLERAKSVHEPGPHELLTTTTPEVHHNDCRFPSEFVSALALLTKLPIMVV